MKKQKNTKNQCPRSFSPLAGLGNFAGAIVTYVLNSKGLYPHILPGQEVSL